MTHPPDRVARALELDRTGQSPTAVARHLGVPRETVREWLAERVPGSARSGEAGCDRCGGPAHDLAALPASYVYLLGIYLGTAASRATHAGSIASA